MSCFSLFSRLSGLRRAARVIRLAPFDTATPEGRSRERYRRTALSAAASAVAKGITLVTTAVTIPLTLGYLGSERFGIWMTLSAIVTMLAFTDLGIGNSLLNSVAAAAGRGDRALMRTYVSSGLAMLLMVSAVLGLAFVAFYGLVPWANLLHATSTTAVAEIGPAAAVLVACFLVGMPAGALQQVRIGIQEGFVNSIFVAIGSIAGLLLVVLVIQARLGLPWLVLALAGPPVVATLVNGLVLVTQKSWLRPAASAVHLGAVGPLLRIGLLFLVLQLAVTVAFTSDYIVAGVVLGPSAVAEYTVVSKLFLIPTLLVGFALTPLWPAYREALSRGDLAWVRRTFRRSMRLALMISAPVSLALVVIGLPLIFAWVGTQVRPPLGLVVAFGIWTPLLAVGTAIAMLMNAAQVMRFQIVVALTMAVTNIVLSVALASRIGLAGVVWGSIIGYSACTLIPVTLYLPRLFARLDDGGVRARDDIGATN